MADGRPSRTERAPLRPLSLSARVDAVVSPTFMGMSFPNSACAAVWRGQSGVRVEGDSDVRVFSSLSGTTLRHVEDLLAWAASEAMRVLTELRAVGRADGKSGRADV